MTQRADSRLVIKQEGNTTEWLCYAVGTAEAGEKTGYIHRMHEGPNEERYACSHTIHGHHDEIHNVPPLILHS